MCAPYWRDLLALPWLRILCLFALPCLAGCRRAPSVSGAWDASVSVGSTIVPFRFVVEGDGADLRGSFFNGNDKITSTTTHAKGETIVFSYPEYGSTLAVRSAKERLEGTYTYTNEVVYPFEAQRIRPAPTRSAAPTIAGLWTVEVTGKKNEQAWRLIVGQSGADVSASILRLDGDSGAATGRYDGHKFVLGHFSGARPLRLELTPQADGTLTVELDSYYTYRAVRAEESLAKGLPEPADPSQFTRLENPTAPFAFSFPDIDGRIVSNTDRRFQHKVVIVSIGGSWCPGCHDEVRFLVDLHRKYHDRGLEVVFLSFEEARELKTLDRLRAFVTRYHVDFPVLVAGDTRLVRLKLPEIVNLEAFPTTLYVGRDGIVRGIHTGFAGTATGSFHQSLTGEMTVTVERLLAEP